MYGYIEFDGLSDLIAIGSVLPVKDSKGYIPNELTELIKENLSDHYDLDKYKLLVNKRQQITCLTISSIIHSLYNCDRHSKFYCAINDECIKRGLNYRQRTLIEFIRENGFWPSCNQKDRECLSNLFCKYFNELVCSLKLESYMDIIMVKFKLISPWKGEDSHAFYISYENCISNHQHSYYNEFELLLDNYEMCDHLTYISDSANIQNKSILRIGDWVK